jgi:hypothetical protein
MTRRERFLAEMDAVIPRAALLALIAPHYATAGRRRQPIELETMLRIYFLQQWCDLSAPQAEDAIHDSEAMRRFAGVALGDDAIPDEATMLRFRQSAGAAPADVGDRRRGPAAAHGPTAAADAGDDHGCDDHRRAGFDQSRDRPSRRGDAPGARGPDLVLGHVVPDWDRSHSPRCS